MSRNNKKLFASMGVLGVVGGGLFLAERVTDGDSSITNEGPTAHVEHARTTQQLAAGSQGGHLDHPEAFGGEMPRYSAKHVMVAPAEGQTLAGIAREHGTTVTQDAGRSGYGTLAVPEGTSPKEFLAQLADSGMVGQAIPDGIMRAAGACAAFKASKADRANPYQWHLDAIKAPEAGAIDVSDIVVAVLDSGVAYEDTTVDGVAHVAALTLSESDIVAPYDFVNDDDHAGDDNQHGTHIASLIASSGEAEGVAAGVALMPVKVLDADNTGSELDLVEAIYHAVDEGADVINMSLSFAPGYMPSEALLAALEYAADAGVVMVGAAGNNGADRVSYPAASSLVLAVGATDADGELAEYSNTSNRIDVMAPGGDLDADLNGDDVPDGMVAETILPGDPSQTSLWMYAGTSQAAALVSGAAANMLAMGALPEEIGPALQAAAWKRTDKEGWFEDGMGAGPVDAERAGVTTCNAETDKYMPRDLGAAVLPYLRDNGDGTVTPMARISVVDFDGGKVKKNEVWVTVSGAENDLLSCTTDKDGVCTVEGDAIEPSAEGDLFAFEVDSVVKKGITSRPKAAVFANDALEVLTAAIAADGGLGESLLGLNWTASEDAELGQLAEGLSVINMGTGLASSPLGFVVTAPSLSGFGTSVSLDLDGSGLASSPLGFVTLTRFSFDGMGLASSPLGFLGFPVLAIDGTGLASSPLGFHALSSFSTTTGSISFEGSGLASSPLGFYGQPIKLSSGGMYSLDGSGLASSPLGFTSSTETQLSLGGWGSDEEVEGVNVRIAGTGLASSPLGLTSFGSLSFSSFGSDLDD
jgi:hypothetical protein